MKKFNVTEKMKALFDIYSYEEVELHHALAQLDEESLKKILDILKANKEF